MNTRRQFLVKFSMAAGAASILKPLNIFAGIGAGAIVPFSRNNLTLLHTANLKGQWKELRGSEKYAGLGGLNNLSRKISEIKKENAPVLLIDAGNIIDNSASVEQQLQFYTFVSTLGYDAIIPGETDLFKGVDHFNKLIKDSGLHTSGARYEKDSGIYNGSLPYQLINKANLQIAVIDCGINVMRRLKNSRNAIDAINKTARSIKDKASCILTVCILHEDHKRSLRLVQASSSVDIFISSAEHHSINNTRILRNMDDYEVILSYSGSRGTMINRIDIKFDESQQKTNVNSKLLLIGIDDDQYMASIKKYRLYQA